MLHSSSKTSALLFLTWVALIFCALPKQARSAEAVPIAEITPDHWDFGIIPQKSRVNRSFWLHNRGAAPLVVDKIDPGCSCTSTSEITEPVAPGDSVPVVITLKTGRYQKGVRKTSKIHTNDPSNPIQKARLTAYVIKEKDAPELVRVSPMRLRLHAESTGDSLVIENRSEKPMSVTVVHVDDGVIDSLSIPETIQPAGVSTVTCHVRAVPDVDAGSSLTLNCIGGPDTTRVTIPIERDN